MSSPHCTTPGWLSCLAITSALAVAIPTVVPAKIDLVTLPNRDTTQVTIYESEDLTLVRETRST